MQGRPTWILRSCIILLAFVLSTLASKARHDDSIQCLSDCGSGNALNLGGLKILRCNSTYVDGVPWSRPHELTAPHPESIDANWYIYKEGSSGARLALNISWTQKRADLESGKVDGYFLEYDEIRAHVHLAIDAVNKSDENEGSETTYARFDYLCAGTRGWVIRPKRRISINVRSLPLYKSKNAPQPLSTTIKIPSCFEEERIASLKRVSMPGCREFWENTRKTRTSAQMANTAMPIEEKGDFAVRQRRQPDHTVYYVLTCVVATFLVIAILLKMAYNTYAVRRYPGHGKILMINPLQDNCDLVHTIATKLRTHYRLDVTCNWENQTDIGDGALDWYREKMEEINIVVFAMSHEKFATRFRSRIQSNPKRSAMLDVELALNAAQALTLRKAVIIVFLVIGNLNVFRSFWLRQTSRHTVYDTSHTFWMFMQQITGSKISKRMNLEKLLNMRKSETDNVEDESAPLHKAETSSARVAEKETESRSSSTTASPHAESKVSLYENVDITEKRDVAADIHQPQWLGTRTKCSLVPRLSISTNV